MLLLRLYYAVNLEAKDVHEELADTRKEALRLAFIWSWRSAYSCSCWHARLIDNCRGHNRSAIDWALD